MRQTRFFHRREWYLPTIFPRPILGRLGRLKYLILLVGAPRFELGTPSPPDWCANRAALRSEAVSDYSDWSFCSQHALAITSVAT